MCSAGVVPDCQDCTGESSAEVVPGQTRAGGRPLPRLTGGGRESFGLAGSAVHHGGEPRHPVKICRQPGECGPPLRGTVRGSGEECQVWTSAGGYMVRAEIRRHKAAGHGEPLVLLGMMDRPAAERRYRPGQHQAPELPPVPAAFGYAGPEPVQCRTEGVGQEDEPVEPASDREGPRVDHLDSGEEHIEQSRHPPTGPEGCSAGGAGGACEDPQAHDEVAQPVGDP